MTTLGKSPDPKHRMGVYTRLAGVPDRYRLYKHTAAYEGRDAYQEYLNTHLFRLYDDHTQHFYNSVTCAGRDWKEHMADRGRHHALATPDDVETWCQQLLDRLTINTAYSEYWTRIEGFYSWLQWHTEHPHVYHPPLMAAATEDAAGTIWDEKISRAEKEANE